MRRRSPDVESVALATYTQNINKAGQPPKEG